MLVLLTREFKSMTAAIAVAAMVSYSSGQRFYVVFHEAERLYTILPFAPHGLPICWGSDTQN